VTKVQELLEHTSYTAEFWLSKARSTRLPVTQINIVIVFQVVLTSVPPAAPKTA